MITLDRDKLCEAKYASAWSVSIFGNPKMTIICGNCCAEFATRSYHPFNKGKPDECIVAHCPYCTKWNKVKLQFV